MPEVGGVKSNTAFMAQHSRNMPEVCNGFEPPKRQPNQKPKAMLYNEFCARVGNVCTEERYHAEVEPYYYDFDGNKDQFCLHFIGYELPKVNDCYLEARDFLAKALAAKDAEQIEVWSENVKMWDEIWNDLMARRRKLIERIYA